MSNKSKHQALINYCEHRLNCDGCPFDYETAWCNKPMNTRFRADKLNEWLKMIDRNPILYEDYEDD